MFQILSLFLLLSCLTCCMSLARINKGTIIGGGRIGNLLYELNGKTDQMITRDSKESISSKEEGPIYVCTRNNVLEAIIDQCPDNRKSDLIFLQNGILAELLKTKKVEDNTQALIYFAVSKLGEPPIDGKTDLNPEGLTAVTGKWADDLAARLDKADLACKVLDKEPFTIAMLEKHIWICAFMAVGSQYEGCTVGDVESKHTEEVIEIIKELAASASYETGVTFTDDLPARLCAYARSVAHFPTALKEFEWRNGWFANISLKRATKMMNDLSPKHTAILSNNKDENLFFKAKKSYVESQKAAAEKIAPIWYGLKYQGDMADAKRKEEKQIDAETAHKVELSPQESLTKSPTILKREQNVQRMLNVVEYREEMKKIEAEKR